MTRLVHKEGNIFDTTARAIGHGVNTRGAMGAGIAVEFRKRFPNMYEMYREWCVVDALEPGDTMVWYEASSDLFVCNIASQDSPGPFARLEWLEDGVKIALEHLESVGVTTLALPRIGSGIGGLDQAAVEELLTRLAESSEVDIELWTFKDTK